jgi:predicted dehydrogenase
VGDSMLGKTELAVTPQQALDVIRAIELAFESSRERRTVEWRE